ncbi:MAG: TIGR03435 family protein [Bryobacteraceae bacterium]
MKRRQARSSAQPASRFEVVSIKRFPSDAPVRRSGIVSNTSGRMKGRETLWFMLVNAYGISSQRLVAPDWTKDEIYDVEAIAPADASKETRMQMMQAMLVERLALKCHFEEKQTNIYSLTVGSGPLKLSPSAGDPPPMRYERGEFKQKSASFANLVFYLTMHMDHEVVDFTGLPGRYAFDLDWKYAYDDPANITPLANGGGRLDPIFIIKALKAIGLKLEPRKTAMKYLVVDSVNKEPTPN